jgi:hypothetical protein
MPESVEIETNELQEAVQELHEERAEREKDHKENAWTRFISLSTAILAVFAAVGAMQAGGLVNEAMVGQIKAADAWNEYQASRQKDHLYTITAYGLLDSGVVPAGVAKPQPGMPSGTKKVHIKAVDRNSPVSSKDENDWRALPPSERLAQYISQVNKEQAKEDQKMKDATGLEDRSGRDMERFHIFEHAVAMIQVAVALSAIAALLRNRPVWYLSMAVGILGILFFLHGALY